MFFNCNLYIVHYVCSLISHLQPLLGMTWWKALSWSTLKGPTANMSLPRSLQTNKTLGIDLVKIALVILDELSDDLNLKLPRAKVSPCSATSLEKCWDVNVQSCLKKTIVRTGLICLSSALFPTMEAEYSGIADSW